jgi:hypothetical protein
MQQQEMMRAEREQRSRDGAAFRILTAAGDARYRRAFDTVAVLKSMGTIVTVWDAQDGIHVTPRGAKAGPHLCVTFQMAGDCECTGNVDEDGSLSGEPLD